MRRSSIFLFLCIVAMQLLQHIQGIPPPELRAHLEARVMSSMSLKDLERMVENDERVINAPKRPLIVIPKAKSALAEEPKAYIIHRKPSKKATERSSPSGFGFSDREFDELLGGRSSFEPRYRFESAFKMEEEFPSLFGAGELESAGSDPVKSFYEAVVEKSLAQQRDPIALLEVAASADVPSYKPRFDYESYSKDPTDVKLKGKKYWKDAPQRRDGEETVDENGCRTVVKKVVDPKSGKEASDGQDAKSIIITKECEYPNLNGPEAKIQEMESSHLRTDGSELNSEYDNSEPPRYLDTRPVELDFEATDAKTSEPLGPDYIDRMLESHFKSFPGFSNPISSFKGYQDRFKLSTPAAFKDIKPAVKVESYDYSHPKSGFESERDQFEYKKETPYREYDYDNEKSRDQAPVNYNRDEREYDYVDQKSPRKPAYGVREHHYHYDHPVEKKSSSDYDEDKIRKENTKDKKSPKMMKKSFAYYRKDKPKEDPNEQHYAEEYAQGNYRSFSSDYDSERDGPKKQ